MKHYRLMLMQFVAHLFRRVTSAAFAKAGITRAQPWILDYLSEHDGCIQRELADRNFRWLRAVYDRCHDVRRVGAASVDLCYVAAGRLDAYVESGLKPWDFAAGLLIVQEAGGAVLTADGAAPSLKMGGDVMGTNGAVTEELLAVLRQAANG